MQTRYRTISDCSISLFIEVGPRSSTPVSLEYYQWGNVQAMPRLGSKGRVWLFACLLLSCGEGGTRCSETEKMSKSE